MTPIDLSGTPIFLTGALGAIAEYVVRALARSGASLILTDIKPIAEAVRTLEAWEIEPGAWNYIQADLTDSAAVERAVACAFEIHPRLATVLGHAGGCGLHPFADTAEAEFERIFRFNYFSQTFLARAALTRWTERGIPGHLIFTSSYVARVPHTRIPAYATAKAALESLTKCLALEYARYGIRVNAISPGNVAAGSSLKVFEEDADYRDFVLRIAPLGRRNSPEAVANVFLFLCSPLASEVNGQVVSVDMGISIPKIG